MDFDIFRKLLIIIIPLIFAITLHEVAHGWVAKKLGDNTAYLQGRLTLNPIAHIDWLGTLLVPALSFLFAGVVFGWAKPVPVIFSRLKNQKRDPILVSLAGPGANLLMIFLWLAILLALGGFTKGGNAESIAEVAIAGMQINLVFMIFNLLPILPLDGGRVLQHLLPQKLALQFSKTEPYGMFILMGLVVLGIITPILGFFSRIFFDSILKIIA